MPGLHVAIPVPALEHAQSQIPSNYKGISTSSKGIKGTGVKMPLKVFEVSDDHDVQDIINVEVKKDIKNASKTLTSEMGTGR